MTTYDDELTPIYITTRERMNNFLLHMIGHRWLPSAADSSMVLVTCEFTDNDQRLDFLSQGVTLWPNIDDSETKLSAAIVAHIHAHAGVTTDDTHYSARQKIRASYWRNF